MRKQVVHKVCCNKNYGRKQISEIDVDSQNQRLGKTHFTLVETERSESIAKCRNSQP